uniref:HMG box domain containing 3 n=1 Tax=Cyprinus carpio TaxID=7962 RepID=A0A8C2A970_CYPCA
MEAIYGEMEVESCYTLLELPSPKKKRKSKGSVESSDKPKKSAYLLYYFDVHQSVQQEHPDLPQSEINKCISDSWKRLNVADRGYYLERARMEKDGIDPVSLQSAAASSQDVPGFRKILPRANYVLLPKSSAGGEQVEGDGETDALVDGAVDGAPQAPAQETLVSPMTLGSEVELSEQCIAIEALSEDAPSQNHTERLPALLVKREESRVSYGDVVINIYSVSCVFQGVMENKVINTASPIMMFPLVSSVKPEPKLSFKLPIKYTRRGRGNCTTPGCVFSYVTRHKPPQCPDCGQHLGGKWVAPVSPQTCAPVILCYSNSMLLMSDTHSNAFILYILYSGLKPSANEHIAGLKPSTLKQLGHMITPSALQQVTLLTLLVTVDQLCVCCSVPQALGLSTARGRGRCKNPACDYVYKNRHKPQHCPTCGCELANKPTKKNKLTPSAEDVCASALLSDASQPLSSAQKDQQRHSTVSLLRSCLQFPESESELQDVFSLIQQLNGQQKLTEEGSGWPSFFEPAATHCSLCQDPLLKGDQSSLAGLEECWLLTECSIRPVTLQLKVCTNLQCLAIHSFTDLHPGLFNVGNKLLVTLDLFFKMRHQIRLGDEPVNVSLCVSCVQDLFCSGYWAFECLTVRDYNDMICGVCGIAPKLEIAQRNSSNVLLLKNVEFTWPDFQATDEVHVDEFWLTMENEALEQAAFPSSFPITRFDASIIAPFIPPLMRNTSVINTEKDKDTSDTQLRGRVSKVCPHQVVCGSKYIVRRESARDHLDLLVSSRFWPPVYVADCAQKVALCTDVLYPELASQMWGKNQGCFSDPTTPPQYVSCSELQDQPYSLDLTVTESNPHLHPLTKSASRWIVQPDGPNALHDAHHAITLCKELEPYTAAVAEICDEPEGETSINDSSAAAVRRKALVFDNAAYYYLYNRLLDFLSSRDIVNQQITEALSACQPGEVVMIRDALYRLGVAQINSDPQETADGGLDKHSDGVVFEEVMLI